MLRALLLAAFVANVLLLVSSTDSSSYEVKSSSRRASHRGSFSSSTSNSKITNDEECEDDDENSEEVTDHDDESNTVKSSSNRASSSTSESSRFSSTTSNSNIKNDEECEDEEDEEDQDDEEENNGEEVTASSSTSESSRFSSTTTNSNIKNDEECEDEEDEEDQYDEEENNGEEVTDDDDDSKVSCGNDPNAKPGCGQNCKRCSNYNKGPVACPLICKVNGCDCKPNYIYDDNIKKCVLPSQCTPVCGANQTYAKCPDLSQSRTCDQVGYPLPLPTPSKDGRCRTKPACVCLPGYVKNNKGVCISPNDCRTKKCTKPNEVLEECPGFCPARTCAIDDRLIFCPKQPIVGDKDCKPAACRCASGFYRNYKGDCVTWDQCRNNQTCPKNEVYDLCLATCPFRTCGIDDTLIDCMPSPRVGDPNCPSPACRCADGFFRNDKKVCVPWKDCPKCSKPNEVYDPCFPSCPGESCSVDERLVRCKAPPKLGDKDCIAGCRCKDGYKRNQNGQCIPKDKCTLVCGTNEVSSSCINGGCQGAQNCSEIGKPIRCVKLDPKNCIKGCLCKEGHLRNKKGVCVPENQCKSEPVCGTNEVSSSCINGGCQGAQNCSEIGKPVRCVKLDPKNCIKGCLCKEGHLRNEKGICVPENQCKSATCSKPNEVYDPCFFSCPGESCLVDERLVKCRAPPQLGDKDCIAGCRCKDGFKRNIAGQCIPKDKCKTCTRPHEYYDPCADTCPPQVCESINSTYHCPIQRHNKTCVGSCRCESGHLRNKNGDCITIEECLKCTGPHEFFSCGGACDNVCSNLREQNQTNCPIRNIVCNKMCYCEDGYARNADGICVPYADCEPAGCNGDPNAVEVSCGRSCRKTCSNYKNYDELICTDQCRTGCDCKPGYVYDNTAKKCVIPADCPLVCGTNEVYSSCKNGGCQGAQNCSEIGKPVRCVRLDPKNCIKGCLCKEGHLRNEKGVCVPENQCKNAACSKPNEVYDPCFFSCPGESCLVDERLVKCRAPPQLGDKDCIAGCRCKDGFKRNIAGQCIPRDKCKTCTRPHEYYDPCADTCPPQVCESINSTYHCPIQRHNKTCVGSCRCESGHLRNKNGDCITIEECLKCTGPHEFFSCGGACDNVCSNLSKQNQTSCPIINIVCNKMCYCEDGYARNADGICVPYADCEPETPTCGLNEIYSTCTQATCRAQKCSEKGKPIPCPRIAKGYCKKGCVCKEGFLKTKDGTCVPEDQCPPKTPTGCSGDPNAVEVSCGRSCRKTCSNYKNYDELICLAVCRTGCDCIPGMVYDETAKKCVLPADCQPTCPGPNEVYSGCSNGGCFGPRECAKFGGPTICVDLIEGGCVGGCLCKEGFYRNDKNICVPAKECKGDCGDFEIFSNCTRGLCRNELCSQQDDPTMCIALADHNCEKGCVCQQNYLRHDNGTCIPSDQCPRKHGFRHQVGEAFGRYHHQY